MKKELEGDIKTGDRVLVLDDVVTSGGSTIQAIEKIRAAGHDIAGVIALVDREEQNGRQNIEAKNVKFEALFTIDDLRRIRALWASATDVLEDLSQRNNRSKQNE